MNKSSYLYNPVANQFFQSYNEKLFENEQVDNTIEKICDNALNVFKILNFDLAPKRERNADVIRVKLSKIADSSTVKSLTANLIDYADDSDLLDSRFAETKRIYLESLKKLCEALNRTVEIAKGKEDIILKDFRISATKLQSLIDTIAKQAEEEEKKKSLKESEYFYDDTLNESLFTGYKERVSRLKKLLTNLITSAEGKDQKSGYGRDWKREFIDLDVRVKAIDNSEAGDKNRKALDDLEKKTQKLQEDFYNSLIQTANRSLQKLEDDEEVYTSYGDVINLVNSALDLMTRAKAQYSIAMEEVKNEIELKDAEIAKAVFPLKRGDTDSDRKIKGSKLIYNIQTALCNGIPSAGRLIKSKGGPNGKYGPATTSVIATIQKMSGNKNTNGQIDQKLLSDIISSDWVSEKDKKAINGSLKTIGSKMTNESQSHVHFIKSVSEFLMPLNEEKIVINNSDFEKELSNQYKSIASIAPPKEGGYSKDYKGGKKAGGVKELSKSLRSFYNIKIESEDFLKTDGTLKSSYTPEFISGWNSALSKVSDKDPGEYSYFFFNNGVYNINLGSTSLKTACNWTKWAEARQIRTLGNEDATEFLRNYLKGWTTFGMVRPEWRYDGIKKLIKTNSNNDDLDLSGPFEMIESSLKNKEIPFIDYENLRGDIAKAFNIVLQKSERNPDLGKEEFVALNNFLIIVSNCVTFDGSKFISCIKWINDNVFGESTAKRITKDMIFSMDEDDSDTGPLLSYEGSKIIIGDFAELERRKSKSKRELSESLGGLKVIAGLKDSQSGIKRILGNTAYYISADIYPSIATHVKRMNAIEFDQVPQQAPFKCVNTDK